MFDFNENKTTLIFNFLMKSLSIISFLLILQNIQGQVTLSNFSKEDFSSKEQRYLIYNVNFGEGFNLRRDVYMRIANTVRHLRKKGIFF